jgi:hypothetical protein
MAIIDDTKFSMYMSTPTIISYILVCSVVIQNWNKIKNIQNNITNEPDDNMFIKAVKKVVKKIQYILSVVFILVLIFFFTTQDNSGASSFTTITFLNYFFMIVGLVAIVAIYFVGTIFNLLPLLNKNRNYGNMMKNFVFYIILAYTSITIYNFSIFKKTFTRTKKQDDTYETNYGTYVSGGHRFYILLLQGIFYFLFLFIFNNYSEKYKIFGNEMIPNGKKIIGVIASFYYILMLILFIYFAQNAISGGYWVVIILGIVLLLLELGKAFGNSGWITYVLDRMDYVWHANKLFNITVSRFLFLVMLVIVAIMYTKNENVDGIFSLVTVFFAFFQMVAFFIPLDIINENMNADDSINIKILDLAKAIIVPAMTLYTSFLFIGINYTEYLSKIILYIIGLVFVIVIMALMVVYKSKIASIFSIFSNSNINNNSNGKMMKHAVNIIGAMMIIGIILMYLIKIFSL